MPNKGKKQSSELVKGKDSGRPSYPTKIYVSTAAGGKCSFPGCPKHLIQDGTNVGKFAHIIPRKVGFVREDWKTPLEDRKKAANLLFVCGEHHDIIDNPENEKKYSADTLFSWKRKHESWVRERNEDTTNLPSSLKRQVEDLVSSLYKNIESESKLTSEMIGSLISQCRILLRRNYLDKAELLIDQTEILLTSIEDEELRRDLRALRANFLWKQEKIPSAKNLYLEIIGSADHIEAMLDYVELCYLVPEAGDERSIYQKKLREIVPDHPRLRLIDLNQDFNKKVNLDRDIVEEDWCDDDFLNSAFYRIFSLFLDASGDSKKRDLFVDHWEEKYPDSPAPNMHRVIFAILDLFRVPHNSLDTLTKADSEIRAEKEKIYSEGKYPISPRGELSILFYEIKKIEMCSKVSPGFSENLKPEIDKFWNLAFGLYFDPSLDDILPDILSVILLDREQWDKLIALIMLSNVQPSDQLVDWIFLHAFRIGLDVVDVQSVLEKLSRHDWQDLIEAVRQSDAEKIVSIIDGKAKSDEFKLAFIQSIEDINLRLEIVQQISFCDDHELERSYFILECLIDRGDQEAAVKHAKSVDISVILPSFLMLIGNVAYDSGEHRLFIESGEKLLNFDLTEKHKAQTHGQLAHAYIKIDDDLNAKRHAVEALKYADALGGKSNLQAVIQIAIKALQSLDESDAAAELSDQYSYLIEEIPQLGLLFADTYLKTKKADRAEKALQYVISALTYVSPDMRDEMFLAASFRLNILANLNSFENKAQESVAEGSFFKIDGVGEGWFFIGEPTEAFGAVALSSDDKRYGAVFGKQSGEKVDWPAYKYTSKSAKIDIILNRETFLNVRAHEVMKTMADQGHAAVLSLELINEDGDFDKKKLLEFHQETHRNETEFFDQYCEGGLPFSMLCRSQGSLQAAIAKISAEGKGLIRCSSGTEEGRKRQLQIANEIHGGKPFFIDGLSTLMLCDADLVSVVVEKLPNIHIATSAIKVIRDLAEQLQDSGSTGRLAFIGGRVHLTERDPETDEKFRQRLIESANILDGLSNRTIGNVYKKGKEDGETLDLDSFFPTWLVDAVRLAQENDYAVVCDDALSLNVYQHQEGSVPPSTSSLSLIRTLYEKGDLPWETYLKFFGILSGYRYFHLPVSADEMERCVLGSTAGGLITFTPKNLDYLNLGFTLSKEYGVDDKIAIRIISIFLSKIILRDDVTEAMAEDIFSRLLVRVLDKRDAELWGGVICELCETQVEKNPVASSLAHRKLHLMKQQVLRYAREFNPIFQNIPSLLKIGMYS